MKDGISGCRRNAVLFVASHEIIPGAHRRWAESVATVGLTAGFAAMLMIDAGAG